MSSKFVKSSLHSILAVGSSAGDGFRISNPDHQPGVLSGEPKEIIGHEAYLRSVSQSMVGTGFATSSVTNPLVESLMGSWPGKDKSLIQDLDGAIYTHNNVGYAYDEAAPSLGSRPVAIIDELSKEEQEIYLTRGTILKKFINESALVLGFLFDIPNELKDYSFNQTNTYFPLGQESLDGSVESAMISAPFKRAYISAALIECLLMLCDPTKGDSVSRSFWT
jgi:hypothetical protein